MRVLIVAIAVALATPLCAAERQLNVPLTLEDQAVLIPQLCEAATYGYRAQFQGMCDALRTQLLAALTKAEAEKRAKPEDTK